MGILKQADRARDVLKAEEKTKDAAKSSVKSGKNITEESKDLAKNSDGIKTKEKQSGTINKTADEAANAAKAAKQEANLEKGAVDNVAEAGNATRKFVGEAADEGKDLEEAVKGSINEGSKGAANATEEVKYGEQYTKVKGKKSLKANIKYETAEGYKYITDKYGRIAKVEANLELGKADRNLYAQRVAGREDRLPNDDGGHIIASIFNGSGDLDNLVPMNSTLNRGEYRVLENTWRKALNEIPPKKVEVKIKPIYEGESLRPARFKIDYKIEGVKYSDILTN